MYTRVILGHQFNNPNYIIFFANVFAYYQHRNHAATRGTVCASITKFDKVSGLRCITICSVQIRPLLHCQHAQALFGHSAHASYLPFNSVQLPCDNLHTDENGGLKTCLHAQALGVHYLHAQALVGNWKKCISPPTVVHSTPLNPIVLHADGKGVLNVSQDFWRRKIKQNSQI